MLGELIPYTSLYQISLLTVLKGHYQKVAQGLFESLLTPPEPTTALYKLLKTMW